MSELARIERVVFLQTVPIFSYCTAEEILRISAITDERQIAAGESVYEPNRSAQALFCLVRGRIDLSGHTGDQRRIEPGVGFGYEDILTGRLRTHRAVASVDSLLLAIAADDFFDFLANNVEIVKGIFRRILPGGISPEVNGS